jgi:hypothetical protein
MTWPFCFGGLLPLSVGAPTGMVKARDDGRSESEVVSDANHRIADVVIAAGAQVLLAEAR